MFSFSLSLLSLVLIPIAVTAAPVNSTDDTPEYDYIVVGSGPGGAPVAAQLAKAGHSVVLLDAGDDQRSNTNVSVAIVLADVAAEDEKLRWDFFVRYHKDDDIELSNRYMTWRTREGDFWVGQGQGPEGAERLGIYYPRSGTLGGCSSHNAGNSMIPQDTYWNWIAELTGDDSWGHENMRRYFTQFERNMYLSLGTPGHGFNGFLSTSANSPEQTFENQPERLAIVRQLSTELGHGPDQVFERMSTDVNSLNSDRDFQTGLFNSPFHHTPLGNRTNANDLLQSVLDARNPDGSQTYPLTIQLESLVSKVLFDKSGDKPRAIGVEYLPGKSLYTADPRAPGLSSALPTPKRIHARKEVIISGGVFNTPQILKLSGIGPAAELTQHNIPVLLNLPGVGARLQDDYEISIAAYASTDLTGSPHPAASSCTLGIGADPCVDLWRNGTGPYAIPGATHSIHLASSVSPNAERDLVLWNPDAVFRGFYPGYSRPAGDPNSTFSFAMAHAQGRNHEGGSVKLRSADPRDVPDIFFNFWAQGAEEDLQALYEGVEFGRRVLAGVDAPIGPFDEFQPCVGAIGVNCSEAATKDFIRRQVYSHHASSSAAIGKDGDELAVLDGDFRVRGVQGLRVVDGSALPQPPSPFPIIGQFMASYKAAEAILKDA